MSLNSFGQTQEKCIDLLKVKSSSDATFEKLKALSPQQQAIGVHEILKNAFYPLMERVKNIGQNLKDREVRKMLTEYQGAFPIKETEYLVRTGGRIPLISSSAPWGRRAFITLYESLTGNNLRIYRWIGDPAFAQHASGKAFWVEPSEKLVISHGDLFQMLSTIPTPSNAYGERFSKNLLRTTQIMMNLVHDDPILRDLAVAAFENNHKIFSEEVGRVMEASRENADPRFGAVAGVIEGILSFHQFLSATLGEKIEGVDTGSEALRQIVQNSSDSKLGLTAEFTSRLTLGLIGPVSNSGYYFKSPYKVEADGKLSLSANLKEKLAAFAKKPVEEGRRKGRCPMAGLLKRMKLSIPNFLHPKIEVEASAQAPTSTLSAEAAPPGLQLLAETYLHIFNIVNAAGE